MDEIKIIDKKELIETNNKDISEIVISGYGYICIKTSKCTILVDKKNYLLIKKPTIIQKLKSLVYFYIDKLRN